MGKQNNKWIHGATNLVLPPLPNNFMKSVGVFYLTVTLDQIVGDEIILIIYDPTDFIYELKEVIPFRFCTSSLAINTSFGPVFSFLFWVTQPDNETKAFAIFDKPVDISKPLQIQPWKDLANQTHLHLLLVDADHDVQGFYEFENDYGIDEAVESISLLDHNRIIDFAKAKQEYFRDYQLPDLFELVKNNG